jgi:hypothetical protein
VESGLHQYPVFVPRRGVATHNPAAFQEQHPAPVGGQLESAAQPGKPCPHDDIGPPHNVPPWAGIVLACLIMGAVCVPISHCVQGVGKAVCHAAAAYRLMSMPVSFAVVVSRRIRGPSCDGPKESSSSHAQE